MGVKPEYKLIANSQDVTAAIRQRFGGLRFSDAVGVGSDELELTLTDNEPARPIIIPARGAELELYLGYDGETTRMGLFVLDEIEAGGGAQGESIVLRARSALFAASPQGKTHLNTQKSRAWPKGTTIGAMVAKIAREHGLEPIVSESLRGIALPHTPQTDESDLSLLLRLSIKYDATAKPAGGYLIITKRGDGRTASGEPMPTVTIAKADASRWRAVQSSRETAGTVVAYHHATRASRRIAVKVGEGEPVRRLKMYYPTEEMALAAARSELARRERRQNTLAVTAPGHANMLAESNLNMTGFRDEVGGAWIITRATHSLTASGGWACDIEAERPNDGEDDNTVEVLEGSGGDEGVTRGID